jgi:type III pantothenate kinase
MGTETQTILLVDIGNSNTVFAESNGTSWVEVSEIKTSIFGTTWSSLGLEKYDHVVVSSVVPSINTELEALSNVTFVTATMIPLITLNVDTPDQVGADRLVNAVAAYHYYSQPTLIIDSGTAVTFCFVDEKGVYQGGAILPGMGISSQALQDYTAKIPYIQVEEQNTLVGKSTKQAVEVGLYHGYMYMINGFINAYRKNYKNLVVVGTGKGLGVFKSHLDVDVFDDELILKGLCLIANNIMKGVKNNV